VRVIYTTASPLGGTGLGEVAGHAVAGIWGAGSLVRAITVANRQSAVPADRIREVRFQPTRVFSMLPSRYYYPMKRAWVDRVAAAFVDRTESDLVHGWTHECVQTLTAAKRQGAVMVLERNYAHPRHSRAMLEAEYAAAGIGWPGKPWPGLSRYDHWDRELTVAVAEMDLADVIVVPAEFTRETLVAHGVPPHKIRVVTRGVDGDRFQPARPAVSPFRVLFVGQVCLRKGIRYLLEAWRISRLPGAELVLVGAVHDEVRAILAQCSGLSGLRILGYIHDVARFYAEASVFVLPTLDEGSAKAVSEAMAAGLPVVTTPEAGSLVEDGKTGYLVPSRDVERLAERLAFLHAHPTIRRDLGAAARNAVLPYSWERYQRSLLDVYQGAMARRREAA
jgi:glycosyltransferase involved in cell wall biosynthesis